MLHFGRNTEIFRYEHPCNGSDGLNYNNNTEINHIKIKGQGVLPFLFFLKTYILLV